MTAQQQVYSCSICGNLIAVVHQGGGRLVCCGRPMTLAGQDNSGAAKSAPKVRQQPAPKAASDPGTPYWKCSNCKYVLQAAQPPEVCPSCQKNCQFIDVTCYIPECGFSGADSRLISE